MNSNSNRKPHLGRVKEILCELVQCFDDDTTPSWMRESVLGFQSQINEMAEEALRERRRTENSDQVDSDPVADPDADQAVNNPMNLEPVIRKLLSFLHSDDLQSCRLVNSLWNRLSIPYLKQKCDLIIFSYDNLGWINNRIHGVEDVNQFIQCVGASSSFPYGKLDVDTLIFNEPEDKILLVDFFKTISPIVTELMIRDDLGESMFSQSQSVPEGLVFPSMKMFAIDSTQDSGNFMERNFQFITNMFANSPVLDKLKINLPCRQEDDSPRALTLFLGSISTANCLKISNLEISTQIGNDHLIYLSNMKLKLKTVFFEFFMSNLDQKNLKMFLQSQSTTLESLTLSDPAGSAQFSVEFPCMRNLKSLVIQGSNFLGSSISYSNISYVNQFPALKRLTFSDVTDELDEFLKFGIQPVTTVEELELPGNFDDKNSLQQAAHLFPNLKLLGIPANSEIMTSVYDSMTNIEELILNPNYVDTVDDVITGLSKLECHEIRKLTETMFQVVERGHMSSARTKPLLCLKKLKVLRLKYLQRDQVELTDVSCRLVLLKMESLKCLDLGERCPHCPSPGRVSRDVLLEMRERFAVLCKNCPEHSRHN